jgi:hypothetical protein
MIVPYACVIVRHNKRTRERGREKVAETFSDVNSRRCDNLFIAYNSWCISCVAVYMFISW